MQPPTKRGGRLHQQGGAGNIRETASKGRTSSKNKIRRTSHEVGGNERRTLKKKQFPRHARRGGISLVALKKKRRETTRVKKEN